jgi:multicomponent Na+:H+ antiporter subunit B
VPTTVELALLVFVLGCALGAAVLRDVLSSVIAFAAYSLGVSIIWIVLQAPDVALTEAAVGAGVMTILFLLALANTSRPSDDRLFESISLKTAVVVLAFVAVMATTVPALPAIGGTDNPVVDGEVSQYYLDNAYDQTQVHNAVTAVLAGYRGLDTLGEAVVVFVAGIATLSVLRREAFA